MGKPVPIYESWRNLFETIAWCCAIAYSRIYADVLAEHERAR